MPAKQMFEDGRQKKAYEIWWNGGNRGKGYQKVADEIGVTKLSIYNWAHKFKWLERAEARESKIQARIDQMSIQDVTKDRIRYITIIRKAITLLENRIDAKDVTVNISDLDKLARLHEFLRGEPDSRNEELTLDSVDREIRKLESQLASEAPDDVVPPEADTRNDQQLPEV